MAVKDLSQTVTNVPLRMKRLIQLTIFFFCVCNSIADDKLEATITTDEEILSKPTEAVKILDFSLGGEHFYRKHLLTHTPVLIKNGAKNWPLLKKWNDLSNKNQDFLVQEIPIKHPESFPENTDTPKESIRKIIEDKLEVRAVLENNSKLLEEIHLPLFMQCQEYIKTIHSVVLNIHIKHSERTYNERDEVIMAFDKPFSVLLYASKDSGGDIEHIHDPRAILLNPGDLLYIPKYTLHQMTPISDGITYTKINFDYHNFEFKHNIPFADAVQEYKTYLTSKPAKLKCNNTKTTFKHSLNLAIDFDNKLSVAHLRIPVKNKRPDDVVLASGYKMPVLGLGTAMLNESTYDAVKFALHDGYRMFDLAHGYPHSETSFSRALADSNVPREDVFVVTKLAPRFLGYKETLFAIDDSLARLNTSYIDLYLIHSKVCDNFLLTCEDGEPKGTWKESWRAMEDAVHGGKIRSLGVSNFYEDDIHELLNWSAEPVSVLQNWFDPFNPDRQTRSICAEYNIRYMGYSTLGNYWKFLGMDFNPVLASSTITGIAANYDYVVASVVLRWAIHENVTVIPRSSNPKHIGQNIRALDLSLLQEEIDLINGFEDWMNEVDLNSTVEDIAKFVNIEDRTVENEPTDGGTEDSSATEQTSGEKRKETTPNIDTSSESLEPTVVSSNDHVNSKTEL